MQVGIHEKVRQYVLHAQQVSTLRLQEVRSVPIAPQTHTVLRIQVRVLPVTLGDIHRQDRTHVSEEDE